MIPNKSSLWEGEMKILKINEIPKEPLRNSLFTGVAIRLPVKKDPSKDWGKMRLPKASKGAIVPRRKK